MAKITTPNKHYSGEVGGVRFVGGEGETDNPSILDWFRRRGYIVEGEPSPDASHHPATGSIQITHSDPVFVGDDGESAITPGDSEDTRTKDELKDELRELGLPVSGSKDELLERLQEAQDG